MEISDLKNITVSSKTLENLFGYDHRYISELVEKHRLPKKAHNQYPLLDCIKWYINYQAELHEKKIKEVRKGNSRFRLEVAQAALKELELKEKQNELGPIAQFELAEKNNALLYKKGIEALKSRLPFDLNLNPEQANELNKQCDGVLNQIANLPADANAEFITF